MSQILGLKFRDSGSIYYFDSGAFVVKPFDRVIVNTDQGMALAKVVLVLSEPPDDFEGGEIKPIYRLASEEDLVQEQENEALAQEAFEYCRKSIVEHGLEMKLVDVDVFFDRGKIVFYFTAPNRIDFRELVKDLVRNYRTRIELRQIGVRHETQMTGAVGNCGQLCCCRRFLRKFAPVTIKMAKEQNLFLNPTKISGICGRLLCCLAYEQENYEKFHAKCPRVGKRYMTERGGMKVLRANFFRDSLSVLPDGGEEEEIFIDEWGDLNPQRPDPNQQPQQRSEANNRPKREKPPRKPRGKGEGETPPRDEAAEAPQPVEPEAVETEEPADEAQQQAASGGKPDRKRKDQKRGRRGSRGRKRDADAEKQGGAAEDSDASGKGGRDSSRKPAPRDQRGEEQKPEGKGAEPKEAKEPKQQKTQNLPAVQSKSTFGISGIGAKLPPAESEAEHSAEAKPAQEAAAPAPEGQPAQEGDAQAKEDGQKPKGKGRSRSSRRRPSRRSGRGRGGGGGGEQKSGEAGQQQKESGGSEGGQRKSRPRRRRRKPKQDKPKE
ncbi:regulatory iron-sulfur-containing complex subunit RicT [Oceanidesulfovibrio marinus]|uniref:PSP1 C-terminal domain-containing protein n=1 Tax=Oceanidesulfovibrio marinus TaxID=370038 RepID=A0A6P1ZKU7_9BACT|nr:regulatory iron-sulfur-containing complex subunit RicT [Oceanidesulfovibrio marinus]TVM34535.1 hypothetical protein DQK91_08150 [Oceanidesulfovibrio marinus]